MLKSEIIHRASSLLVKMIRKRRSKPTANMCFLKANIDKNQNDLEIASCILLTISVIKIFPKLFIRFALSVTVSKISTNLCFSKI